MKNLSNIIENKDILQKKLEDNCNVLKLFEN
jgi:hypothetical protein